MNSIYYDVLKLNINKVNAKDTPVSTAIVWFEALYGLSTNVVYVLNFTGSKARHDQSVTCILIRPLFIFSIGLQCGVPKSH